jgi:hypothetical protein
LIQAPFFIARPGPAKVRHHAGVNRAKGRRPISSCVYSRLATSDFAGGTEPRGVPLIVAPGHRDCGAVAAAVHGDRTAEPPVCLTDTIPPAVMATRGKPGDPVNGAVRAIQPIYGAITSPSCTRRQSLARFGPQELAIIGRRERWLAGAPVGFGSRHLPSRLAWKANGDAVCGAPRSCRNANRHRS